jgi:predicted MPP superfamily phosphohydrolase
MTRRKFLSTLFKGAVATGVAGGGFALADVYSCVVSRREILLPGLAPAFDGFRIGLMSDFHHSWWIPENYIRHVVKRANGLGADLFALTGDFVHKGREWVPGCAAALSGLRAPHGVAAVLGNHDHYANTAPAMRDGLARAGIRDLTNRGITLQRGGESLHVAGTGDYWREKQLLHRALSAVRIPRSVVLLQHNPDYVEKITDDRVGLVLSGHTHGGQCVLPFVGAPILPSRYGQKYASGLCQGPVAPVFVTTGVGSAFPPVRFCCPPEIALLTLRSPKHHT